MYIQSQNPHSLLFPIGPQVQESSDVIKEGRVRVVFTVPHEPQLEALIQNQHVSSTHTHTQRHT